MRFQEGEYYAIEFSSIHNEELQYRVETCKTKEEVEKRIVAALEDHGKSHWPGETLLYTVWQLCVAKVPVKTYKHAIQVVLGDAS